MSRLTQQNISAMLLFITAAYLCINNATAHQPPSEEITQLTQRMETEGANLNLYTQRAFEHLAQGNYTAAQHDLEHCIESDQPDATLYNALAKTHLALNNLKAALKTIEFGLSCARTPHEKAALYATQAHIQLASNNYPAALHNIQSALSLGLYDIEWAILRSRLQAHLTLPAERIHDLESACTTNPSIVLQYELLDARIDSSPDEQITTIITNKLAQVRWKSSWNLRLARVYLQQDRHETAHKILDQVINEINHRYNPDNPHLGLLAERGEAYALLGMIQQARDHLTLLQSHFPNSDLDYYHLEMLLNTKNPVTESNHPVTGE